LSPSASESPSESPSASPSASESPSESPSASPSPSEEVQEGYETETGGGRYGVLKGGVVWPESPHERLLKKIKNEDEEILRIIKAIAESGILD